METSFKCWISDNLLFSLFLRVQIYENKSFTQFLFQRKNTLFWPSGGKSCFEEQQATSLAEWKAPAKWVDCFYSLFIIFSSSSSSSSFCDMALEVVVSKALLEPNKHAFRFGMFPEPYTLHWISCPSVHQFIKPIKMFNISAQQTTSPLSQFFLANKKGKKLNCGSVKK